MGELEERWRELVDAGEVTEDFEGWYSGLIDQAMDRLEDR
jgi:hypothetical protein